MIRRFLKSKNLYWAGYDDEYKTLEVGFNSGRTYEYHDVPKELYEQLMESESHGKFFNMHIKGCFEYQEITEAKKMKTKKAKKVKPVMPNGTESVSSIEISRDAKGIPRWTIKVYAGDSETNIKKAIKFALNLDKWMCENTMVKPHEEA